MFENFQGKEERNTSPYVYLCIKQPSKVTRKLVELSVIDKDRGVVHVGITRKRETALMESVGTTLEGNFEGRFLWMNFTAFSIEKDLISC